MVKHDETRYAIWRCTCVSGRGPCAAAPSSRLFTLRTKNFVWSGRKKKVSVGIFLLVFRLYCTCFLNREYPVAVVFETFLNQLHGGVNIDSDWTMVQYNCSCYYMFL